MDLISSGERFCVEPKIDFSNDKIEENLKWTQVKGKVELEISLRKAAKKRAN